MFVYYYLVSRKPGCYIAVNCGLGGFPENVGSAYQFP